MRVEGVFDGELVAFAPGGHPSWPLLCRRVLRHDGSIPLTFVIFDVLELDGEDTSVLPYAERRRLLDSLNLVGPTWRTPPMFEDGPELFDAVCRVGVEGIIGKRLDEPYKPGERGWLKVKNRGYWRYPYEVAALTMRQNPVTGQMVAPREPRTARCIR
jgi:bifunctional non-homologous end joining protein LigD